MAETVSGHLLQGVNLGRAWHVVSVGRGVHPIWHPRVGVVRGLIGGCSTEVFPDGDEFHLRRDNALACIPELSDRMIDPAERLPLQSGVFLQFVSGFLIFVEFAGMLIRDIPVIFRAVAAPLIFLNVTTCSDPLLPETRKALGHLAIEGGVSPWP